MPGTRDTPPETLIAFDFGLRRIGVAVGQPITGSASPLGVVANGPDGPDWPRIETLLAEWRPGRLVVGMPLHTDGSPSLIKPAVDAFITDLARYGLPVATVDECYTSLEARQRLVEGRRTGQTRRIRKEMVDAAAAVLIAERWLARMG
ncbi:MAG TPA: Holliday junction resolvase RuvX [Woeseiaceae bacterium]|nr:Holliday junction resolvase RuvX [Woeseiaceae bacterium]